MPDFFADLWEALIPYVPTGTLQIPSNVTRISRALRRHGLDGTPQIIYYHSGVGTGSSLVDTITGGLLGTGISEVTVQYHVKIRAGADPSAEYPRSLQLHCSQLDARR